MHLGRARLLIFRIFPQVWRFMFFAGVACALVTTPAAGQVPTPTSPGTPTAVRTFEIRGWLRMASNNMAAEGIRIDLKKFTGETVSVTFTRGNGEFEFGGLSNGIYTLQVEEKGYEPLRESIEIRGSARQGIFLYLREPVQLEESRPQEPVSARELALPSKAADALRKGRAELFDKNNPGGSLKHLQKVAREAPDFYEADFYLGVALSRLGRADEAEASLRKAIASSGETHAPSFVGLASVLNNKGRFSEAVPMARKGVELDPAVWQAHFELARALNGIRHTEEALTAAQAALEKNRNAAEVQLLLANIHMRRGDARGLLAALDGYLKLQPEGPMSEQVRATRSQLLADLRRAHGLPAQPTPTPPPPR